MAMPKPTAPEITNAITWYNDTFHLTTLLSFTDKGLSNPIDDANDKAHETSSRCLRKALGKAQRHAF